jgi:hypothetical protein
MTGYAEHVESFLIKIPGRKVNIPRTEAPSIIIKEPESVNAVTNGSAETIIPFDKWIMPAQPEEYLKPLRYDFL